MVDFRQVLCAVDLSEQSVRTLKYAGAVARWYGGRLTALHVVPTFDPLEVRVGGLFDPVQIVNPVPREAVVDRVRETLDAADIPPEARTSRPKPERRRRPSPTSASRAAPTSWSSARTGAAASIG